jgi:hypothetical protein
VFERVCIASKLWLTMRAAWGLDFHAVNLAR